jgi:hypothetical protein
MSFWYVDPCQFLRLPAAMKTPDENPIAKLGPDGRDPGAGGLVVEADAHQRVGLHHAQAILQAPAEQRGVARGDQEPGAAEAFCSANQRIRLGDGVAKVAQAGRVAR